MFIPPFQIVMNHKKICRGHSHKLITSNTRAPPPSLFMSPMDEQTLIIIATLHEILIYDNEVGHRHHRVIYANLLI